MLAGKFLWHLLQGEEERSRERRRGEGKEKKRKKGREGGRKEGNEEGKEKKGRKEEILHLGNRNGPSLISKLPVECRWV